MQAGRSVDAGAARLALKADMGNFALIADAEAATPAEIGVAWLSAWQWLLVAALALMAVEAVLSLRGRIS